MIFFFGGGSKMNSIGLKDQKVPTKQSRKDLTISSVLQTKQSNSRPNHSTNASMPKRKKLKGKRFKYKPIRPIMPFIRPPILSPDSDKSQGGTLEDLLFPAALVRRYSKRGVSELYQWQLECLACDDVWEGKRNLLFSAPTSAGKTMVAEALVLLRLLSSTGTSKGLIILPYVSIVQEKVNHLKAIFQPQGLPRDLHLRIAGYFGQEKSHHSPLRKEDIAVCTIEKANSIVGKLIQENRLHELRVVVVDEAHLLGDSSRGYLLELLLAKLMHASKVYSNSNAQAMMEADKAKFVGELNELKHPEGVLPIQIQIIAMSATLPNMPEIAQWLNAILYTTNFRPVVLTELIKAGSTLYDRLGQAVEVLEPMNSQMDHIILSKQIVQQGDSVLLFCLRKVDTHKLAKEIAEALDTATEIELEHRHRILEELRVSPYGLDPGLEHLIRRGVAYHHASLTIQERTILENAFRQRYILVLVATSTLAAGVNLPARRVIIKWAYRGKASLSPELYQQMAGRAGRAGQGIVGDSILLCSQNDLEHVLKTVVHATLPPLYSCLGSDRRGASRALLEAVSVGWVKNYAQAQEFMESTLLACQASPSKVVDSCNEALNFLETFEMIEPLCGGELFEQSSNKVQTEEASRFQASKLGLAIVSASMDPHDGLVIFRELERAVTGLVLENELHLLYLVVPITPTIVPPWQTLFGIFTSPVYALYCEPVGRQIGWSESFLLQSSIQPPPPLQSPHQLWHEYHNQLTCADRPSGMNTTSRITAERFLQQQDTARKHARLFSALMLMHLIKETPLLTLERQFGVQRGELQSLQDSACMHAAMVSIFCRCLRWNALALLLERLASRLSYAVSAELLPLMKIPKMTALYARALYDSKIETVDRLATCSTIQVENLLRLALPFHQQAVVSSQKLQEMNKFFNRVASTLIDSAKVIVDEKFESLHKIISTTPNKENNSQCQTQLNSVTNVVIQTEFAANTESLKQVSENATDEEWLQQGSISDSSSASEREVEPNIYLNVASSNECVQVQSEQPKDLRFSPMDAKRLRLL